MSQYVKADLGWGMGFRVKWSQHCSESSMPAEVQIEHAALGSWRDPCAVTVRNHPEPLRAPHEPPGFPCRLKALKHPTIHKHGSMGIPLPEQCAQRQTCQDLHRVAGFIPFALLLLMFLHA